MFKMDIISDFYAEVSGGFSKFEVFFMPNTALLHFALKQKVGGFSKLKHLSDAMHAEWLASGKPERLCLVALPPKGATDAQTKASFYQALRSAMSGKSKHVYPAEVAINYIKKKYVSQKLKEIENAKHE